MKIVGTMPNTHLDSLKEELRSHAERMDETETSIVIVSLNSGMPRLTTNVRGKDRVKMLGAMTLATQDLTTHLIEEW